MLDFKSPNQNYRTYLGRAQKVSSRWMQAPRTKKDQHKQSQHEHSAKVRTTKSKPTATPTPTFIYGPLKSVWCQMKWWGLSLGTSWEADATFEVRQHTYCCKKTNVSELLGQSCIFICLRAPCRKLLLAGRCACKCAYINIYTYTHELSLCNPCTRSSVWRGTVLIYQRSRSLIVSASTVLSMCVPRRLMCSLGMWCHMMHVHS
jgi:hypothetical protein